MLFNGANMNDTVFKYNHGDVAMILARASNNTLTMNTDDKGLRISADIMIPIMVQMYINLLNVVI